MFKEILCTSSTEKRGNKRKLILGVGINDAPYKTSIKVNGVTYACPFYTRWLTMLTRCYSKKWLVTHPTYVGCFVVPEWHSFMAFKDWMLAKKWEHKQLDKDLLSFGSKKYSPDTCMFVSPQVNSLFNTGNTTQGDYPVGIYPRKGKYEVGVSYGDGKRKWVGVYATVPEAIDAYVQAKLQAVDIALKHETDLETRTAVKNFSKYFTDKLLLLKAVS